MLVRPRADARSHQARFPWFMKKARRFPGVESLIDIDARVSVDAGAGGEIRSTLEGVVPVTSLCPCSNISAYGARTTSARTSPTAPRCAATGLRELVSPSRRPRAGLRPAQAAGRNWVTERAYDSPKFVGDLVRHRACACGTRVALVEGAVGELQSSTTIPPTPSSTARQVIAMKMGEIRA